MILPPIQFYIGFQSVQFFKKNVQWYTMKSKPAYNHSAGFMHACTLDIETLLQLKSYF